MIIRTFNCSTVSWEMFEFRRKLCPKNTKIMEIWDVVQEIHFPFSAHAIFKVNLDLDFFSLSESVKFFETYLSLVEMSSCKMHQAFPSLEYKSFFAHLISGTGLILRENHEITISDLNSTSLIVSSKGIRHNQCLKLGMSAL